MTKHLKPRLRRARTPDVGPLSVPPRIGGPRPHDSGVPDIYAQWSTKPGWSAIQARFNQAGWSPAQVHDWLTTPLPEADGRPPEVLFREDPAALWSLICQSTLQRR